MMVNFTDVLMRYRSMVQQVSHFVMDGERLSEKEGGGNLYKDYISNAFRG
jgi:hypothetical protein